MEVRSFRRSEKPVIQMALQCLSRLDDYKFMRQSLALTCRDNLRIIGIRGAAPGFQSCFDTAHRAPRADGA
jgi:hypothetical protein